MMNKTNSHFLESKYYSLVHFDLLCLPRHCDEGEQCGDNNLLHVYIIFDVLYNIRSVQAKVKSSLVILKSSPRHHDGNCH